MTRILSTLMLAVLALVAAPNAAAEYHPEMAEFADLLNETTAKNGINVSYDGTNVIMDIPSSFFTEDQAEMFASCDDLQPLAPYIAEGFSEGFGQENVQATCSLFEMFDVNLVIRINFGTTTKQLTITPEQLRGK